MYCKYHAKKVVKDGEKFDSTKEYKRWLELKEKEERGEILLLERQVAFELIPAQYRDEVTIDKKGKEKVKNKLIERPCTYIADFTYSENDHYVVEDSKGLRTPEYRIKRKLMLWVKGIKIKET